LAEVALRKPGTASETFREIIEGNDPEAAANVLLGLVAVTCYLLQRQVKAQEQSFIQEGGLRERMSRVRRDRRDRGDLSGSG